MTQEEKAKAYDEALKWMRELYPGLHGATKEDAEHYFPQLRESEDERIRKWLVDYFSSIKDTVWIHRNTITCEQILAWLEKQKEPKQTDLPAGFYFIDLDGKKYYSKEFRYGDMKLKVREQKPISQEDFDKAKHEALWEEQKPAWSEEDEEMLNSCISSIEEAKENRYAYKETDGDTSYDHEIAWLKSLRPCPSWKPSEEQMKVLEFAFRMYGDETYRNTINSLYNDLKKL